MDRGIEITGDNFTVHPGEMLEEKLQEMEMPIEDFAEQAHIEVKYAKDVIASKASVTPETAVAFEMVTKIPATLWMGFQHDYDNYMLRHKKESWVKKFMEFSRRSAAIF